MPVPAAMTDTNQAADVPVRVLAAEITREKVYLRVHEELPYSAAVETTSFEEKPDGSARIEQTIYVERDSQKAIVLGRKGETIKAIGQAARDRVAVLVCPIAFVSEHIETLVELDIEYAELAEEKGAPGYTRVPAAGTAPDFVSALAGLVKSALAGDTGLKPPGGTRLCPARFSQCPCRAETA